MRTVGRSIGVLSLMVFISAATPVFSQERGRGQRGAAEGQRGAGGQGQRGATPARLVLRSSALMDGGRMPEKYAGAMGISPPFEWTNVPAGTVSFALILHDANGTPQNTSFEPVQWVLWNIPGTARSLPEGIPAGSQVPDGTQQGKTNQGTNSYRGSNPPPGDLHHLLFDFYALDQILNVPNDASRDDLLHAMDKHTLGKTVFVSTYSR
jgi:Raf kinase inhibitor-like YbhB/YbcL family protein